MPRILYAINTIILGYVLTLAALVLNFIDGDRNGMALALLSFAAAYFSEGAYVHGTNYPRVIRAIQYVSIAACGLSLAVWYF